MFSYTGLTPEQVAIIQADSHVYMLQSGRINVAGCKSRHGKDLGPPYSVDHLHSDHQECRIYCARHRCCSKEVAKIVFARSRTRRTLLEARAMAKIESLG